MTSRSIVCTNCVPNSKTIPQKHTWLSLIRNVAFTFFRQLRDLSALALSSKSSSHRLFDDSWSSIYSSVCNLHYAICRFSILWFSFSFIIFLFFPFSPLSHFPFSIINFLVRWTILLHNFRSLVFEHPSVFPTPWFLASVLFYLLDLFFSCFVQYISFGNSR